MRNVLVVGEISAALVLLLATTVLVQNLRQLQALHRGFNPDGIFQARLSIPPTYRSPQDIARFYERLSERIAASPGVEQVGVISVAPLSGFARYRAVLRLRSIGSGGRQSSANIRAISSGYLSTVGTRLLQGRLLEETDTSNTRRVALVSAALADRLLSGGALGQQLLIDDNNTGSRPIEIVGVVENVRDTALDLPPAFDIYVPLRQIHSDAAGLLRNKQFWTIKMASDPAAFRTTFLAHLGASIRMPRCRARARCGTSSTSGSDRGASTSVRLARLPSAQCRSRCRDCTGWCRMRSASAPEIGLRMALGATPRDVYRMILRQAAGLGMAGAVVGLCLAAAARR